MPVRRTSVALASAALLVVPAAARAEPAATRVVLHYQVDGRSGCPSAPELQASIVSQLGYDPFTASTSSAAYHVQVGVQRRGGVLEADIAWLDEGGVVQGERRLSSPEDDCVELAAGIEFAVAVQLQLLATGAPPSPAPPTVPSSVPPPPRPPRPPSPMAARGPSTSLVLALGGVATFGRQPGVAAGARAVAEVGRGHWALHVDTHATLSTNAYGRDGGFSAQEWGVGAAPCLRLGIADTCAVGAVTLLTVRGEGVDHSRRPSAIRLGVGARLQLSAPWFRRIAALVHVDVLVQLGRRDVVVNRERVWSTAPLGVAIGLDAGAIFR